MNRNKHFIATTDEKTADLLRTLGYEELPKQGNRWMFINDAKSEIVFSSDNNKINYTNVLTF